MTEHPHFQNPNRNSNRETSNDSSSLPLGKYSTPEGIVHDFLSGVIDFDQFSHNLTAISERMIQDKRVGLEATNDLSVIDDSQTELENPREVVRAYQAGKISRTELGEAIRRDTERLMRARGVNPEDLNKSIADDAEEEFIHDSWEQQIQRRKRKDEIVMNYVRGLEGSVEAYTALIREETEAFQRACGLKPRRK